MINSQPGRVSLVISYCVVDDGKIHKLYAIGSVMHCKVDI